MGNVDESDQIVHAFRSTSEFSSTREARIANDCIVSIRKHVDRNRILQVEILREAACEINFVSRFSATVFECLDARPHGGFCLEELFDV